MAAVNADNIGVSIHGRRLGIAGDGANGSSSALVLDGVPIGSTRSPIVKAITSGSGAGSLVLAGAAIGDLVLSVTDLSSGTDVSADFEAAITVAGHIQQATTTSGHQVLVVLQPQS